MEKSGKIEIKYKDRVYEVEEKRLNEIVRESFEAMRKEEQKQGFIGTFGMLSMGGCFGCGDFVDYTGNCKYSSKTVLIKDGIEKRLCKSIDIPLCYAIDLGILDGKYQNMKEALKDKERERLGKFGIKMEKK